VDDHAALGASVVAAGAGEGGEEGRVARGVEAREPTHERRARP
jgi:hypothetical protein